MGKDRMTQPAEVPAGPPVWPRPAQGAHLPTQGDPALPLPTLGPDDSHLVSVILEPRPVPVCSARAPADLRPSIWPGTAEWAVPKQGPSNMDRRVCSGAQ